MTSYMDQERQQNAEWREEQLNWMHQQHEQLVRQTTALERIAAHTSLLYGVGVVWLIVLGLAVIGYIVAIY